MRLRSLASAVLVLGLGSAVVAQLPGRWHVPDGAPQRPGRRVVAPVDVAAPLDAMPNLSITSVSIVDSGANPITPTAGSGFYVRVDYRYDNPVCTEYVIQRTVNGWQHEAPVTLGCGLAGATFWFHYWGVWVMHENGTYSITVTLDSGDAIAESDETDNTLTISVPFGGTVTPEWELVGVDAGRTLLGDGTGVIVGTMDDALDHLHPWLDGDDSLGQPRLVAALQNSLGVGGSPVNADHATAVMGITLARGLVPGDITGMVPDARYVTAEFLNRANTPGLTVAHVFDAAGFLVDNGAEVINMSWSWYSNLNQALQGEGALTNLMADYLAYGENIVCVPAVNQLAGVPGPTAPGAARNTLCVGGLDDSLLRSWCPQNSGPTTFGRSKPDVTGNDAANAVAPTSSWRLGLPATEGVQGTSFAAPFVTGAVAQLLDYGKANGESLDHLVMKAVVMNSGKKTVADCAGNPWSRTSTHPLDNELGTGVLDMTRAHAMYAASQQTPPYVAAIGYDVRDVVGDTRTVLPGGRVIYKLGTLPVDGGRLDATLAWDRHTYWNDINQNNRIDRFDTFFTLTTDAQDNLDLVLFHDGVEVDASRSVVDNVEHVAFANLTAGEYELHVERRFVTASGGEERYALAWLAEGAWTPARVPTLVADVSTVSVASGGQQTFIIDAGSEHAGLGYLVVGSASGTSPGFTLQGVDTPLNLDGYYYATFLSPNQGIFVTTAGMLDGAGGATAGFVLPASSSPSLVGLTFDHACYVIDAARGLLAITDVTNAVGLALVP